MFEKNVNDDVENNPSCFGESFLLHCEYIRLNKKSILFGT